MRSKYGTIITVHLRGHLFSKKIKLRGIHQECVSCDRQTGMCTIGGKLIVHERDIKMINVKLNTRW